VGSEHSAVVAALLEQLASSASKKAVQKKAITCLGATAVVLSEPLLNQLVESLLTSAQSSETDSRVIITAIGQVSVDVLVNPLHVRKCRLVLYPLCFFFCPAVLNAAFRRMSVDVK
jgi:hypothetical protein